MMKLLTTHPAGLLILCMTLAACGEDAPNLSFQDRFEAVYAYTDCKEVIIGTALSQPHPVWMISYQTYYGGYLDLKESTFLDEKCKTSYTFVNRWVAYRFLSSSNEQTGEIHLEVKTRRILSGTSDWTPPELPGLPDINCNIEMADDFRKEECKTYFDTRGAVTRYVTLNLTDAGLQPFRDIDSAGTTEETRSPQLAPYVLNMLDAIKK